MEISKIEYMFKTISKIFLSGLVSFLLVGNVLAVDINQYTGVVAGKSGYKTDGVTATTLSQTVGSIIKVALSLIGTIFLILTIYAGFLWMTAGGNEENVEKATKIIKFAVVGLIIILASYSITWFVMKNITGATAPQNQVGGSGQQN